jgi:hypothetical protein
VVGEAKGELTTELFGIFEGVTIVERRGRRTSAPEGATVRARLNSFIHQQFQSGHFHRYSWHMLRGALRAPVAKRLYVLIDGQRGYATANPSVRLYDQTLDERLLNTLRIRDRTMSRVRDLLRKAGQEIVRQTAAPSPATCARAGAAGSSTCSARHRGAPDPDRITTGKWRGLR